MINIIQNTIGALQRRASTAASIITENLQMWLGFKKADVLGAELVVNGDFEDGSNGWNLDGSMIVTNGKMVATNGGNWTNQGNVVVVGKSYSVTYTISDYISGGLFVTIGGNVNLTSRSSNGTFTEISSSTSYNNTIIYLRGSGSFNGSISNISVKEVTQSIPDKSTNTNNAKLFTGKALEFNGNDAVSDFGNPNINLKSICFWVNLNTTSEQIFNLTATHNITAASGVITLGGTWSNSNIYVDGIATTSIGTTPQRVVITTDTNILVNDLEFAKIGSDYGALSLSDVQIYDAVLSLADALIDYNNPNDLVFNKGGSVALANLVGYWALSEGSGSIAYDSSGGGNNGTISGATYDDKQPTIPQLGMMDWRKYMTFDGVDDYVQLATTTLTGDCTIGFTYNTTSPNGSFLGKASTTVIRYEWYNNDRVIAIIGGESYLFIITTDLVKDSSSMVFTRVGNLLSLYLEGVFVQSKTVSTSDWVFADARIGYSNWSKFNGLISQAYMFSDALSASEVLAIHNTNTIPTTDLYGHWINSGTDTWLDLSTNSNNGTPSGAAKTITLIQNPNNVGYDGLGNFLRLREGGFNLDGSGYAEVADDSTIQVGNTLSLGFWVKPVITSNSPQNLIYKDSWFNGYGVYRVSNTKIRLYLDGTQDTSDMTLTIGSWNYVSITYDGSNINFYLNGVVNGSPIAKTATVNSSGHNLFIGCNENLGERYDGIIDEILIYDTPLTATEILNNYKIGLSKHS